MVCRQEKESTWGSAPRPSSCGAFAPYPSAGKTATHARLRRLLSGTGLPGSMAEHVFNKYPVPSGGVLDEYVGYGSYQFSVLEDGTAAHTLDDSSGQL